MRCITNIYISVLFLTVSVFNYDGKAFYTDDKIVIAIKVWYDKGVQVGSKWNVE